MSSICSNHLCVSSTPGISENETLVTYIDIIAVVTLKFCNIFQVAMHIHTDQPPTSLVRQTGLILTHIMSKPETWEFLTRPLLQLVRDRLVS